MTAGRWQVRAVIDEALRNAKFGGARTVGLIAIVTVLLGALAYVEVAYASGLIDEHRNLVSRGLGVLTVRSAVGMDASRCEDVARQRGVQSSGGVRTEATGRLEQAPGTRFRLAAFTPGALGVVDPASTEAPSSALGWIIGQATATELLIERATPLAVEGEARRRVTWVLSDRARTDAFDRAIVGVEAPVGLIDECWVEFRLGALRGADTFLRYWFSGDSQELEVEPLLPLNEFSRDLVVELESRPQRDLWLVVAVAIALVSGVVTLLRRGEIALYRALGVGRSGLHLMWSVDSYLVLAVGWLLATVASAGAYVLLQTSFDADIFAIGVRATLSACLLAALAAPAWAHLASRSPIADALKDR